MDYYNVCDNIRNLRKKKSLTQERLAELANINTTYLGKIERGESSPTIDTLAKIAKALDMSLLDLLYFESEDISEIIKNHKVVEVTMEYINKIKKILGE